MKKLREDIGVKMRSKTHLDELVRKALGGRSKTLVSIETDNKIKR
jgi:hypothetical protein